MEWLLIATGLYLLFVVVNRMKSNKIISLNAEELDVILKDKTVKRQFIDVRTSGEYAGEKIKGFKNIPVDSLQKRIKEVDVDKPVILMCASGSRSLRAANLLAKNGYTQISHLKGGLLTYKRR